MPLDRSVIGAESAPEIFEIERGAIRRFAEAIGDGSPAYRSGEVAPPTFPTTFRMTVPGVSIEAARVLHGGEEYVYERPLKAGDRIVCRRKIADIYEREGRLGRMTFVVSETEGRDEAGALVFRARSTIIVR
ncbi:MAG TPA: MaoC family dehydratase N-terminal domain-containing protein [Bacillota bacterium]|nr:MaoC family dehydratase N-terminal domain-containing protein [Bacillota bacterium]